MSFAKRFCVVAFLVFGLGLRADADILTPAEVRATSQFGLGIEIDNLVNGSGLDGEGPIEGQLHNNDPNHMWFAGCADAGIEGGTPDGGCDDPFALAPVDEQIVEFELDATYALSSALVWQYNELNPNGGPFPGRGVKKFELQISPTLTDPFTILGEVELEIAEPDPTPGVFSEAAQIVLFAGDPLVRRVRFRLLEAHSGDSPEFIGLSEVRFDGVPTFGPLPPRVTRFLSRSTFTDSSTPVSVRLDVTVEPDTGPFEIALVENLRDGWTATDISDGGSVAEGTVSWMLSAVAESTTLSYTLVPDDVTMTPVELSGSFIVDGGDFTGDVAGDRHLTWSESAPAITAQPQGGRVIVGGSFTFSVEVTGSEPISFQWEKDEEAIDGATERELVLTDVAFEDAGEYSVVVSNAEDVIVSDFALLEVTPPNLALCGIATQSTTLFDSVASRAIDGSTDGSTDAVTHTTFGDPVPWWEVRLGASATIDTIVLWNRNELPERLSNFTVSVLTVDREVVWSDEFFPEGANPPFPDPASGGFAIDIGVEGRIVRVEKGESVNLTQIGQFLSLAEVEVFGTEACTPEPDPECPADGDPDFGDTHCGSIAIEGPDGNAVGDYLVTAQGTDDSGDTVHYTFTAVHQVYGTTHTRGPHAVPWAYLPLTYGAWDVTVTADDFSSCDDEAVDATCTDTVTVTDPTCVEGELCNVAIRGLASQSSIFLYEARLAIDGNTDGNLNNNTVTHTGFDDPAPTWEVELDRDYAIERIVLWNRTDCCSERLTNFAVTLFDANGDEVCREEFFTDGTEFPDTMVEGFAVELEGEVGRTVQVALQNTHPGFNQSQFFLSLAEVQIFAEDEGMPPVEFRRGDVNDDAGVNIADAIFVLNDLFGDGRSSTCAETQDVNGDAAVNIADAVFLLNNLFGTGPSPIDGAGEKGTDCGPDPNPANSLGCETYTSC